MATSFDISSYNYSSPPFCILCPLNEGADSDLSKPQLKLLAYFENRTQGKRLAARADLNPADLKDILPNIAIYDMLYDSEGEYNDYKVRLIGTNLSLKYGEQTGKTYADLLADPPLLKSATRVMHATKNLAKNKVPLVSFSAFMDGEQNWYHAVVLYIPLSADGENINMALSYTDIRATPTAL